MAVDFASIKGGAVPFDAASTQGDFLTAEAAAFQKDEAAQKLIQNTRSVEEVLSSEDLASYDAVFVPGGHGIV
jgi:putative intracellular protease/amidase